jgi:hypothetical protein
MTDDNSLEIISTDDRYGCDPAVEADERRSHRMRPEDMFGLLSDVIDDEFLEIVLGHRRGGRPREIGP